MSTVTRTIRFGWHTIRESYEAKCGTCGRGFKRTVSTGFNDMATPESRAEYRSKLKAEAEAMSREPITCNACQKAAFGAAKSVDLVPVALLTDIADLENEQAALDERKKIVARQIEQHRGRLFLHAGETYAQWGCGFGYDGDRFCVHGYRVSKTRPWETTDASVNAPLSDITYLDDTLENRKSAVRKAQP